MRKREDHTHSLSTSPSRDLKGWSSCNFSFDPDFVAKTQNPFVYRLRFEEFTVPLLADFVDGDR